MSGDTLTLTDDRFWAMTTFNTRNGLELDAQPVHRDAEAVDVFSEAREQLRLVQRFDTATDLETWASTLNSMDDDSAADAVEELIMQQCDVQQDLELADFTSEIMAEGEANDGYDIGDPKRSDYKERIAA